MVTRLSLKSTANGRMIEEYHELESPTTGFSAVPEPSVPTRVSTPSDSALKAWMQVLSAFFVFFNTW